MIKLYGAVDVKLSLGGCDFDQSLIICDINQDAVIGQNFLLKYAENISHKHGRINTKVNEINCWLGDDSAATCRVVVRRTMTIPSLTITWLPVDIPGAENLTKFGYVEAINTQHSNLAVIPGILDLHKPEKRISVVNNSESPITLYAKHSVGTCEAYTDMNLESSIHTKEDCGFICTESKGDNLYIGSCSSNQNSPHGINSADLDQHQNSPLGAK